MPLEIIRNDISAVKADAIVNTSDTLPVIGSGVDSRIHEKAGERLLEERKKKGIVPYGQVVLTPAFNLDAKYVIHAVSPVWDETEASLNLLADCYKNALALAKEKGCHSIAFPVLGAGNMGFPQDSALETAINEIGHFLLTTEMTVYLVVFNREIFTLSEKLFNSVQSYIDEHFVHSTLESEYSMENAPDRHRLYSCDASIMMPQESPSPKKGMRSLDDLMDEMDETFSQCLIRHIKQKGLSYPEVYKKANADRKLFSKIKNNPDYQPKKTTATAFAIALGLNLDETKDLLGKAGYALSHSSKFDIIIEFFITEGNYNIFEINEVLFAFDQNLLI